MAVAVDIRGVSKRFRLQKERYTSLKERVIHLGKVPYEEFWALDGIDLDIHTGETVGLLGHNGSGKSTLLKCVAGILQPTSGEIVVTGRLAALLELGAGFHPELTGRENVFLNASILGMPKREIEKRFDEIVAFAELERFIDNQVKHYSSGMYVRLGFAVAVNMDPDVLLVDEVLSVGDEAFQRKCLDRVKRFQREGRTIIVVTHSPDLVRQVCDRAAVLDHGHLVAVGTPGEAVRSYREHLLLTDRGHELEELPAVGEVSPSERRNLKVEITDVAVDYERAPGRPHAQPGQPLAIRVKYRTHAEVDDAVFGFSLHDSTGQMLFGTNTKHAGLALGRLPAEGEVSFVVDRLPLLDGAYPVTVAVVSDDEGVVYDWRDQRATFEVVNPTRAEGLVHFDVRIEVSSGTSEVRS